MKLSKNKFSPWKGFTQRHLRSFKSCCFNRSSGAGFTLVELLIVIAILGILAAGIVVVINPMEKINSANLAKAKTFAAGVENSLVMSQVGKWSFDDSAVPGKDTSGNGNDGTLYGEAAWQNSTQCGLDLGGCLKFDGVDDYVDVGSGASLHSPTLSVELWFKVNNLNATRGLIGRFNGANTSEENLIRINTDGQVQVNFRANSADNKLYSNTGDIVAGNWYHLAATFTQGTQKLYLNGVLKDTKTVNDWLEQGTSATIIGYESGYPNYMNGFIDEVKIYNKALLSYQIQQLYAQGLAKHLLALK